MSWNTNAQSLSSWVAPLWDSSNSSTQNNISSLSSSTNENTQGATNSSPWDINLPFSSSFSESGGPMSSPSFFSFSEHSRVPFDSQTSTRNQIHENRNNRQDTSFQAYSPLLGPAPFHSTFEKLFINEKSDAQSPDASDEHLDIVSPLFDCEEYKGDELDNFQLNSNENKEKTKNELPTSSTENKITSQQPNKQTRKRSKSKKSKIVLSLQDFQSEDAETLPVEELEPNASPVLWVGNVGPLVSEQQVYEEFSIYGTVINLHILRDKFCAFVTYDCAESACRAKKNLDRELIGEQYVVIHYRQPNGTLDNAVTNPPSNSLWIGNISEDLTEQQLLHEFEQFGVVESIRLLHNCAFVNFFTVDDAVRALHFLQGKQIGQLNLRINFGKNRPSFDVPSVSSEEYSCTKPHSFEEPSLPFSPSIHSDTARLSSWSGRVSSLPHYDAQSPVNRRDAPIWNPSPEAVRRTLAAVPLQYQWTPSTSTPNIPLNTSEMYQRQDL